MTIDFSLRPVLASEHEGWLKLMQDYAEFYAVDLTDEGLAVTWDWIADPAMDFWCTVAVDDRDQLIGFTQYQLMHRSLSGAMVCYLSDLYVLPSIRGGGVGRALIDQVFAYCRSNSIRNVRWLTQDGNAQARKLYDTYGEKSDFILYSFSVDI